MKTELDREQINKLVELGMTHLASCEMDFIYGTESHVSLGNVIAWLPKEINVDYSNGYKPSYYLYMVGSKENYTVYYRRKDSTRGTTTAPELIDALFNLLVWVLTNYKDQVNK